MNIHDLQRIRLDLSKEKFIIPTPESGEEEQTYISRCIS
jgi:hypothetical protein